MSERGEGSRTAGGRGGRTDYIFNLRYLAVYLSSLFNSLLMMSVGDAVLLTHHLQLSFWLAAAVHLPDLVLSTFKMNHFSGLDLTQESW